MLDSGIWCASSQLSNHRSDDGDERCPAGKVDQDHAPRRHRVNGYYRQPYDTDDTDYPTGEE